MIKGILRRLTRKVYEEEILHAMKMVDRHSDNCDNEMKKNREGYNSLLAAIEEKYEAVKLHQETMLADLASGERSLREGPRIGNVVTVIRNLRYIVEHGRPMILANLFKDMELKLEPSPTQPKKRGRPTTKVEVSSGALATIAIPPKKRGRPLGSKNKKKASR